MADKTNIEWCDSTFNPWIGCTKVSPGCDHCYAEKSTPSRTLGMNWGPGAPRRRTSAANWRKPLKWNADHEAFFAANGHRQRVFCASLADVFDNAVDPQWRVDLFALIEATPNLDWLLLTKRIGNAKKMLPNLLGNWMPNVWLGATIINQEEADRDIPKLLAVPAAKRFLSMEPLLGPVDIQAAINLLPWRIGGGDADLHWVIVGGESGPGARPIHPDWARDLRDQCATASVPFLFKQWGEWAPATLLDAGPAHARAEVHHFGDCDTFKVGKKAAGRLLDGIEHNGFPE